MTATYGGIYYPTGTVRIVFADVIIPDDPDPYSYIDLPAPSVRKLLWNKEIIERESYTGELKTKDRGYRPTLEFEWRAPSDTDIGKLIKVANYKDPVVIFPFFDGTEGAPLNGYGFCLRMKLVECDSVPFGGKSVHVIFKYKFKAMQFYSKMFDPDELVCIVRGAFLTVHDPDGGGTGDIQMFVRPLARRREVGYYCNKIFCFQPGFN